MVGVPTGDAFFNRVFHTCPYVGYGKPLYVRLLPQCVFGFYRHDCQNRPRLKVADAMTLYIAVSKVHQLGRQLYVRLPVEPALNYTRRKDVHLFILRPFRHSWKEVRPSAHKICPLAKVDRSLRQGGLP